MAELFLQAPQTGGASQLLALLRGGRPRTRGELAQSVSVSRTTIGLWVAELVQSGLIREQEQAASTGGRRSTLIGLERGARSLLAIDIGPDHARWRLTDLHGIAFASNDRDTNPSETPTDILSKIAAEAIGALDGARPRLGAVGVAIAAPVSTENGRPINPPSMPNWHKADISGQLGAALDAPVVVDKVANMMLVGHYARQTAPPRDMLYVTLSKFGIGAAILANGRLYHGDQGMAGDLAHVAIPGSEQPCRCGSFGCLEAEAATPALIAKLKMLGHQVSSIDDIVTLLSAREMNVVHVIRNAGNDLGKVLSAYVSMFNPSEIVIGGPLATAGNDLLATVRSAIYARSMTLATQRLTITADDAWQEIALDGAISMSAALALGLPTDVPVCNTSP